MSHHAHHRLTMPRGQRFVVGLLIILNIASVAALTVWILS